MKRHIAAFGSGLLFALGLAASGMTRPSKVLGFLDVSGHGIRASRWSWPAPSRSTRVALRVSRRMPRPVVAPREFVEPAASRIDVPLVVGALIFGVGLGARRVLPGPAFAALGRGDAEGRLFVAAMLAGMWLARIVRVRSTGSRVGRKRRVSTS